MLNTIKEEKTFHRIARLIFMKTKHGVELTLID